MNEGERKLIPVTDPEEVPEGMSEEEAREFSETHEFTEKYFRKAGPPPEGVLPEAGPANKETRRKGR